MGILDSIKNFLGGTASPLAVERNSNIIHIVDGDRLNEGRGNPGPAERAGLLHRLAQFAQREQIKLQVVLGGRPLREAGHGDDINGITVYYAEQGGGMAEQIGQLYTKAGSSALVITSDREVEQKIESLGGSARLMKGSSLRKALEGEGGGGEEGGGRERRRDRGDRGERGGRGDRRDRPPRDGREPREPREPRESREPREPRPDEAASADDSVADQAPDDAPEQNERENDNDNRRRNAPGNQTTVKNLIDLVE